MKNRKASDRMAECIIDLLKEYKRRIEILNRSIDMLTAQCKETERKLNRAVDQANDATDTLEEIADIIAGFTEHTDDGYIKVYLSNLIPENAVKLERLFKLLDIPMTADQVKDGDTIEED